MKIKCIACGEYTNPAYEKPYKAGVLSCWSCGEKMTPNEAAETVQNSAKTMATDHIEVDCANHTVKHQRHITISAQHLHEQIAELTKERDAWKEEATKYANKYADAVGWGEEREAELCNVNQSLREQLEKALGDAHHFAQGRDHAQAEAAALESALELMKMSRDTLLESDAETAEHWHAVRKYSLDNLREIIKAAPPAESLEGYTLEYRIPDICDEYWAGTQRGFWVTKNNNEGPPLLTLVRTPIITYLEGDAITDELIQKHGRLPCEFQWGSGSISGDWEAANLVAVEKSLDLPYAVLFEGDVEFSGKCRIKTTDIPEES
jgi:hypothetical protein